MRTGLSKKQKTTSVFFDEASPIIEVCTYNTSLKNRLSEYAGSYSPTPVSERTAAPMPRGTANRTRFHTGSAGG